MTTASGSSAGIGQSEGLPRVGADRDGDVDNVAVIKAALDIVGLAGGPLRPPFSELEPADHAEMTRILRASGLQP